MFEHAHTDALRATIECGVGLPGMFFTDEAVFARERAHIFERTWLCVGLSADAPRAGDLYPVTPLGIPLLLVRESHGLNVFHNVCSHRGAVLVEAPVRNKQRIVCPYHAWSYTLQGELAKTPHVGGADRHECPSLDRSTMGLRRVRSAEWAQHVFVDLSGCAAPFEEWIAPVSARLKHAPWAEARLDAAASSRFDVGANWKAIIENFVESYHLPWVHRALNDVNPMRAHYQILGGHAYLGQGGEDYDSERIASGLPLFSGWRDRARYEALYIFPNLILGPLADSIFSIVLTPQAAALTHERVEFFFAGEAAMTDEAAPQRRATSDFIVSVNREDIAIVERVQRGRASPAFAGGYFSHAQEATSLQLHQIVAAHLLAEAPQSAEQLIQLPTRDIPHERPVADG